MAVRPSGPGAAMETACAGAFFLIRAVFDLRLPALVKLICLGQFCCDFLPRVFLFFHAHSPGAATYPSVSREVERPIKR